MRKSKSYVLRRNLFCFGYFDADVPEKFPQIEATSFNCPQRPALVGTCCLNKTYITPASKNVKASGSHQEPRHGFIEPGDGRVKVMAATKSIGFGLCRHNASLLQDLVSPLIFNGPHFLEARSCLLATR